LPDSVAAFAPAKINLNLHVVGRRDDGYHLLETMVTFANIGDRLTVQPAGDDTLTLTGRFADGLSNGVDNLVTKARDALRAAHPFPSVAITLEKNLPVASGLGGGSSDAAAALRALSSLFDVPMAISEAIAPQLGADVAMCLKAQPLIARGVGEQLTPMNSPRLWLVLVNPSIAVSTPRVFDLLSQRNNPPLPALTLDRDQHRFIEWLMSTRNDLQLPAINLCPPVADALIALIETAPMMARMSGSGATCFAIYANEPAAVAAAASIAARNPNWWVIATQTGALNEIDGGSNGDR
jgi:4-diphosphocytidyl-2-C-methyl-D-erythritol kinase